MSDDLLALFRQTGALLDGHFVLRWVCIAASFSNAPFFSSIRVSPRKSADVSRINFAASSATRLFRRRSVELSSARRWAVRLGNATSSRRKTRADLFCAAAFRIVPNERFIVAEDVVTRGGRVQETIDIVRAHGGVVVASGVIVDRSGGQRDNFGWPFVSLVEMNVETFEANKLPPDLAQSTAIKPGS